jgi:hypothetical protein
VPFDFLKRRKTEPAPAQAAAPAAGPAELRFDGITEEWRLVGTMVVEGRMSDALNKREPIDIIGVTWAPIDGSSPMVPAPGLKTVDPYDLVLVLGGTSSLPEMSEEQRAANRVHKVSYEVALEVPPYRVVGTVFLYPGSEPDRLLDRSAEMFLPVVAATVTMGNQPIGDPELEVVLVNRAYLRGVEQVDARTGERVEKLPGAPLGGTNWTDRVR